MLFVIDLYRFKRQGETKGVLEGAPCSRSLSTAHPVSRSAAAPSLQNRASTPPSTSTAACLGTGSGCSSPRGPTMVLQQRSSSVDAAGHSGSGCAASRSAGRWG